MHQTEIFNNILYNIKLIVYDFDGVMTNNQALIDERGGESVFVNRSDGLAVSQIKKLGIMQVILSTEKNPVVESRAKKLKIPVIHGIEEKKVALETYCHENNIGLDAVFYIGNDINDADAMKIVKWTGCPADAEIEIIKIADWVSSKKGGYGVIRELYRQLLGDDDGES